MLSVTWYGNATLKISTKDSRLVFDPYVTQNPKLPKLRFADIKDVAAILVTHGHFDHVADIPAFSGRFEAPIVLPAEVAENLKKRPGIRSDSFRVPEFLKPLSFGSLTATMYRGRHIKFDQPLVAKTLLRAITAPKRFLEIAKAPFPEGRCVCWLIEYQGFKLFHLGSLGLDPDETYPADVDLLSVPLQGHSKIHTMAFDMIEKFKPKSVLLHHFDDGFPPVSQQIPTEPIVERLNKMHPETKIMVPEYGKTIGIL